VAVGTGVSVAVGVNVGVSVGGTGVSVRVRVGVAVGMGVRVAVEVGRGVGNATPVLTTAPRLPISINKITPTSASAALSVYPNNVNGRKPRITNVSAPSIAAHAR